MPRRWISTLFGLDPALTASLPYDRIRSPCPLKNLQPTPTYLGQKREADPSPLVLVLLRPKVLVSTVIKVPIYRGPVDKVRDSAENRFTD